MILFFISLILVVLSSFLITSCLEQKEFIRFFIYFFVTMFANIVLTFEILSVFSAISITGIITLNMLIVIVSGFIWHKLKKPLPQISFKPFFKKLSNTLKRDKYLAVLGISFVFMCLVSLFLISFMPVVNPDAGAYHVARSLFWIAQGNLNHFDISEVRNLPMPINSEILYAWLLILTKKEIWFGSFSFVGFMLSLVSLYGIMGYIKIPERKKLWAIFILSSFPSVIVQISGTETDIIIAGLVLSSIYLYWNSLKTNSQTPLIISALYYSLAIGTKTPAIILIPAIGLWMCGISYYYLKKDFFKPLLKLLGYGAVCFILFASYNYILNFIDWGNIAGSKPFLNTHQNLYGIRGMAANFIKHLFLFFDFTGFTWSNYVGKYLIGTKTAILSAFGLSSIPDGIHSNDYDYVNKTLLEPLMGMSILGFLVYLPCWLKSFFMPALTHKKRDILICSFGVLLLLSIIFMSYDIMYMSFNIRFLTSFCVIAAPILTYSYPKKNGVCKRVITFFAVFGLVFVSTNLWARPATKIVNYLKQGRTISEIREVAKCSKYYRNLPKVIPIDKNACKVERTIKNLNNQNKILYFSNKSEELIPTLLLQFKGYQIDFGLIENIQNIDLSKYNIILILDDRQFSTNIQTLDKISFSPAQGISCEALNTASETYNPQMDKFPYLMECRLNEEFYKANNYKLYSTLPVELREDGKAYTIEYKFWENQNNPIIK